VKKLVALFVGVAFATTTAGLAVAQTAPAPAEKKTETATTKTKKMPSKNASGTVKSASADSVVVAGKVKGKETEWTFAVDPKTSIKKAGKSVTAADLKEGDQVSVRYMEMDGKATAQAITVRGGSMAKKAPAAKAPAEKK
jgi:hypothetical protein